ncbi:protein BZR1 homolog 3-like [Phoenix dactylifera]|uniref:Protein BZR1 homolog n=1 Tax=Phoenix dactylifera TaxID=42345 RepID=A0A8B7C5W3_PHODC|nr:protein BZR1 homolog 3-like [Phoenix dactylifera]
MPSGARLPTWRERENNKRRERRRRAIAAKIYTGLRAYGDFKLPKHCDNNEVLKALCNEAGWTVEEDGTTYRTGSKPAARVDAAAGGSASPSPCTSYQPSPRASYNPSPPSSSFPSPSSSYVTHAHNANQGADGTSLIPWLKNLSSASSTSSLNPPSHHHFYMHAGSISAPVTPPLSSPTARSPRVKTDWDDPASQPRWAGSQYTFLPSSTPPSPGRQVIPDPAWLAGLRLPSGGPSSPTYTLVSSNPFGFFCKEASAGAGSSRMWTPGQSGTCSPVPGGHAGVRVSDGISDEFAFGSSSNGNLQSNGLVKPWEGERIHEECGSDELELTLGSSRTRSEA